ncbi:MAG: hypothetical protein ACKV22_16720 [Bryobacteraceae bacterium]
MKPVESFSTFRSSELSPNAKEILEVLLGRRLEDDEEVSIWASRPHCAPTGAARRQAWLELNRHLDRMAMSVAGPQEELEKLVDEASDEVRHGPR